MVNETYIIELKNVDNIEKSENLNGFEKIYDTNNLIYGTIRYNIIFDLNVAIVDISSDFFTHIQEILDDITLGNLFKGYNIKNIYQL